MATERVVLVLDAEAAEALVTIPLGSSQERHEARVRGRKAIRAALEQGQQVEEAGTDYLVILRDNRHGGGDTAFGSSSLAEARARANACRSAYGTVRLQSRQLYTGPWTDLPDTEGERG